MNRVAIVFRAGLATGGFVLATSCFSLAGNANGGSIEKVAPVSSATPDIMALESLRRGNATAAPEKFKTVSPSIIAEIGPAPEAAQKSGESGKKKRFDPEPLVIRAGMIGSAAPVHISAGAPAQPDIAPDGHLPPQDGDKPAAANQKKPLAAPE